MAEQAGIDLGRLEGSGPHGRIIKADIERAIQAGVPEKARPARRARPAEAPRAPRRRGQPRPPAPPAAAARREPYEETSSPTCAR